MESCLKTVNNVLNFTVLGSLSIQNKNKNKNNFIGTNTINTIGYDLKVNTVGI